jgi:hypothetical protein
MVENGREEDREYQEEKRGGTQQGREGEWRRGEVSVVCVTAVR